MSACDRLHPAVQHHIVNSLGWRSLRPLQEEAIDPLLAGEHALLIAPTAGGKTEAAIFPVLSRMLAEEWRGLSVLYLCPIKALLNDLEARLERYAGLLGRRVGLWHGDVGQGPRRRLVQDPPDILLTTPESLEAMLIFRRADREALFGRLRVVIVDELHAFAGDFRGWHLLAVAERVGRVAGRELQRLGLSATVGNPEALLGWLAGEGPRRVIAPELEGAEQRPDVRLDFVGSVPNAALVLSRLYRGEKRLVFCDSRARVEELSAALRALGVRTFVSHSSLSLEERRRAEAAFQEADDCVIVATSTLELGIDVGDLDRVIQIDAPPTVASFLQRMGRTGRRAGTRRSCLFLATSDQAFLRAAGLLRLWSGGYVEPVEPPPEPLHIAAQQLLALVLQEGAIDRSTWDRWLSDFASRAGVSAEDVAAILTHMVDTGLLFDEQGLVSVGPEGEATFGRRNFLEVCSVFTSPPLFRILCGNRELGQVHESTFQSAKEERPSLLLAGRSWAVKAIDWPRRVAYVEATDAGGRSRWRSEAQAHHFRLCRAIRGVLATGGVPVPLTQRAEAKLAELVEDLGWASEDHTSLVRDDAGRLRWWTFAGLLANQTLRQAIGELADGRGSADNLWLALQPTASLEDLAAALEDVRAQAALAPLEPSVNQEAASGLKFATCLPPSLVQRVFARLLSDQPAVAACLAEPVRLSASSTTPRRPS